MNRTRSGGVPKNGARNTDERTDVSSGRGCQAISGTGMNLLRLQMDSRDTSTRRLSNLPMSISSETAGQTDFPYRANDPIPGPTAAERRREESEETASLRRIIIEYRHDWKDNSLDHLMSSRTIGPDGCAYHRQRQVLQLGPS